MSDYSSPCLGVARAPYRLRVVSEGVPLWKRQIESSAATEMSRALLYNTCETATWHAKSVDIKRQGAD